MNTFILCFPLKFLLRLAHSKAVKIEHMLTSVIYLWMLNHKSFMIRGLSGDEMQATKDIDVCRNI